MNKENTFITELLSYIVDHIENFGFMPVEFEYEDQVHDLDKLEDSLIDLVETFGQQND